MGSQKNKNFGLADIRNLYREMGEKTLLGLVSGVVILEPKWNIPRLKVYIKEKPEWWSKKSRITSITRMMTGMWESGINRLEPLLPSEYGWEFGFRYKPEFELNGIPKNCKIWLTDARDPSGRNLDLEELKKWSNRFRISKPKRIEKVLTEDDIESLFMWLRGEIKTLPEPWSAFKDDIVIKVRTELGEQPVAWIPETIKMINTEKENEPVSLIPPILSQIVEWLILTEIDFESKGETVEDKKLYIISKLFTKFYKERSGWWTGVDFNKVTKELSFTQTRNPDLPENIKSITNKKIDHLIWKLFVTVIEKPKNLEKYLGDNMDLAITVYRKINNKIRSVNETLSFLEWKFL